MYMYSNMYSDSCNVQLVNALFIHGYTFSKAGGVVYQLVGVIALLLTMYLTHIKLLLKGKWCVGVFNACFA